MKKAFDYRNELTQIRVIMIEDIKLKMSKLFANHTDVVKEICFSELKSCKSNPVYQEAGREDEFTTCIDDIQVVGNELYFNYSSEIQDLIQRPSKDLSLDNCIDILAEIENLNEDDLNFDKLIINGDEVKPIESNKVIDYIEYLQPIIDDIKDGSTDNLGQDDINFIINVIKTKLEYKEGLISKADYETRLGSCE